ncbi:methyltransferase, FxLD system [Streptomyces sp. NPDC006385]|uniref:methyltransferase, FxLD system n=1 Tax=Streptomyces sp. NPDC006385 TaxID=3156761 RepID=UPI0033ADCFE9
MGYTRTDWSEHYNGGRGFRRLGDEEKSLLVEHTPALEGGRALDIGCGTGETSVYLASLGYTVDGADFAEGALERARAEHAGVEGVRWLSLDVERDDLAALAEDGYDLIVLRLCIAFIRDRARVLRRLAARLHEGGVLVIITPIVENTPEERRHIALDENELAALTDGFEDVEQFDAEGLAVLVLRGPAGSFSAEEKLRPEPQAVFGAAVVVTDTFGRVLLGRSTRGMWELPGGRIETYEAAPAAAVRELNEETGLTARVEDAHVITVLHDDRLDVRRVTAVVRISRWDGELALPEPHRFVRWEFHDLNTLVTLGKIFAPSTLALTAVWPGVLPGLPPVHSYACSAAVPPVPGEPAEAVRLRERMADIVISKGWAPSPRVQAALREVPRHRFVPETRLETAYHDDLAVVTVRESPQTALSSVSAAWLQADMIEQLRLEPGMTVLEVGSGGYNAELLAHVLGERGRVVTVEVDPYVVHRTQRLCAEAGSGRVTAVLGDGRLGAPSHVPANGFDGIVITHNASDIAPAWREQLAEGARLVVPLEMGGYTRSLTLVRRGDVLHCEHWTYCGFVRDRGAAARTAPAVPLADGKVTVRWEDGTPADTAGLEEALRGPRDERSTGLVVRGIFNFETLQVYAATTLPGFCRLSAPKGSTFVEQQDAAAILADGSLAYLTYRKVRDAPEPADRMTEFFIHAYGPAAEEVAERLRRVRARLGPPGARERLSADDRPPGRNARRPAAARRRARQAQRTACPPVAGPDPRRRTEPLDRRGTACLTTTS